MSIDCGVMNSIRGPILGGDPETADGRLWRGGDMKLSGGAILHSIYAEAPDQNATHGEGCVSSNDKRRQCDPPSARELADT